MTKPFKIHRPPSSRVDTIAGIIGRFNRLDLPEVRHLMRKPVSARICLSIYREDGSLYDQGSAELIDLSTAGARIGRLELSRGDILPPNSLVGLALPGRTTSTPLQGKVVWLKPGPDRRYGIRFLPTKPLGVPSASTATAHPPEVPGRHRTNEGPYRSFRW